MADTCCEITWLLHIFQTFGLFKLTPVKLFCDSKSALYIASNSVYHERTKHIELDCHLVREKLQLGIITTGHVASTQQPADLFTKALSSATLQSLLFKLGIANIFQPSNLRGDVRVMLKSQQTSQQHKVNKDNPIKS